MSTGRLDTFMLDVWFEGLHLSDTSVKQCNVKCDYWDQPQLTRANLLLVFSFVGWFRLGPPLVGPGLV